MSSRIPTGFSCGRVEHDCNTPGVSLYGLRFIHLGFFLAFPFLTVLITLCLS